MSNHYGSNSNGRLKIRGRGSDRQIVPDVKASREAHTRWSDRVWKQVVQYANGTQIEKNDAVNIAELMKDLGWSPPIWGLERRTLQSAVVKEAREVRPQVREILCWIAKPGENAERDRRAVNLISEHNHGVKLELFEKHVVSRSHGMEHFLDLISRFVSDSLCQISKDLAILPEPSPTRICETQHCSRFFVRAGKHLYCEKHRGVKASRSTDQNRRFKFIRDNLRTPIGKLEKKITSGRLTSTRDGMWKLKCVTQIHIDKSRGIQKRPTDYLRAS